MVGVCTGAELVVRFTGVPHDVLASSDTVIARSFFSDFSGKVGLHSASPVVSLLFDLYEGSTTQKTCLL